jgi:hypothetical protein
VNKTPDESGGVGCFHLKKNGITDNDQRKTAKRGNEINLGRFHPDTGRY